MDADHPRRAPSSSSSWARTARRGRRQPRLGACPAPQRAAGSARLCALRSAPAARRQRPPTRRSRTSARSLFLPDAQRSDDVLLTRFDAAALVPVLQGRQLLLVHVERASDILAGARAEARIPGAAAGAGRRDRGLAGRRPDRRGRRAGDRQRRSSTCPRASSSSPRPSPMSGGCAPPGSTVAIGMIDDNESAPGHGLDPICRQSGRARPGAGRHRPELGRGVRGDQLAAGGSARPGRRDRLAARRPARRRGDLGRRSARAVERPEAVWIDGVRAAAGEPPDKLRDRYRDLNRGDLPEAYRR